MLDTRAFLETLAAHPDATLAFAHPAFAVPPGFHLTEVKALAVEAMDCGGQADHWYETHFQLWHPGQPSPGQPSQPGERGLDARKFLRIVDRVRPAVPLRGAAQARVEWGWTGGGAGAGAGRPAAAYLIGGATLAGETLTVHLLDPRVTCKANEREAGGCGPRLPGARPAERPLALTPLSTAGGGCAPESGCC